MPAPRVSISDVLALLDGQFREMAIAVAHDRYAFWLGSGISRNRMPRLTEIAKKVLDFLQRRAVITDPSCRFHNSLQDILGLAVLSNEERSRINLARPVEGWPDIDTIANRLVLQYGRMLDLAPQGEAPDYLLWEGVDVVRTYGDIGKEPDAEHLCIATLILEGLASVVVSANWDGLIEKAVRELSGDAPVLRVCILDLDLRNEELRSSLFKFHGCAVLAGLADPLYRHKLIGRASQINRWAADPENAVMAAKLIDIVTSKPTLILGLSMQDADIQGIFAAAQQRMPWQWPAHPQALVFSAEHLGVDQRILLQNVYRAAYTEDTSEEIQRSALLPVYAKPLLAALWLHVLDTKLCKLIDLAFGQLDLSERRKLHAGVTTLRDLAASVAQPSACEHFVRSFVELSGRALSLFREGREPESGGPKYLPFSATPVQDLTVDPLLATSGLRELAVGIGLLGMGVQSSGWKVDVGAAASKKAGALRLQAGSTIAQLFFAANAQVGVRMIKNGHMSSSDDGIIVHSLETYRPMPRSPRITPGRTGISALREVSIAELSAGVSSADLLLQRFREEVAL